MIKLSPWHSSLLLLGSVFSLVATTGNGLPLAYSYEFQLQQRSVSLQNSRPQSAELQSAELQNTSGQLYAVSEDNDLGRPPNRSGGDGRNGTYGGGVCPNSVVALVPGESQSEVQVYEAEECLDESNDNLAGPTRAALAYTTESGPSVWVYIPDHYANYAEKAELVLIDNQRLVERWDVPLPDMSQTSMGGVVCVPLPYSLEPDNVYQWRFEIKVNEQRPSENPRVGGLIQKIENVETYWYDELAQLGQQRWSNAEDTAVAAQWAEQLEQEGLGAIASVPIVQPCAVQEEVTLPQTPSPSAPSPSDLLLPLL